MRKKILFIGHSYHKVTKSSEFFIRHLEKIGDVYKEFDDCWKGQLEADFRPIVRSFDIVVVWQLPQVIRQLARVKHPNIIYVPMYDAVHSLKAPFWKRLRNIKIVCFSATLRAVCLSHGLDSFFLQYYPENCTPAKAGYEGKRLFFWQRRPWPNWGTLSFILPPCQFERVHHHLAMDPGSDAETTNHIQPTLSEKGMQNFTSSVWFEKKEDLVSTLEAFNLFFLPREKEGIGFSFLDSMQMGLVPAGFDHATFNEYVVDGVNGFILGKKERLDLPNLEKVASRMLHHLRKGRANYERKLEQLKDFVLKPVSPPNYYEEWHHNIFPNYQKRLRDRKVPAITASRQPSPSVVPLISVITVVRNNAKGFAMTHQSICSQTFGDYEYIVVDGASTDETKDLILAHKGSIDRLIMEKDKGPYDAMMKGVMAAKGKYVIFMNAGDEFAENTSLEDALQSAPEEADIIYGHHYYIRNNGIAALHRARDLDKTYSELKEGKFSGTWLSGIPCHQSTITSRELLLDITFDPTLRIAADHSLLFDACARGAVTYHANTVIARYYAGGLSGKMQDLCIRDWKKIALKHTEDKKAAQKFYAKMA